MLQSVARSSLYLLLLVPLLDYFSGGTIGVYRVIIIVEIGAIETSILSQNLTAKITRNFHVVSVLISTCGAADENFCATNE